MKRPISLSALTVLDLTPPDMVTCAAEVGYSHVGLRLLPATPNEPIYPVVGDTPMVRETLARMDDLGIEVTDIEILRLKPETDVAEYLPVLETAARLGARFALVAGNDPDAGRLADRFAALCDLGKQFGIAPSLEPMPWTDTRNVVQARKIIAAAGRDNGRMVLDAIHIERSDSSLDDIRKLPPAMVGYVQVCDAPPKPDSMEEILAQARAERLFPGEGIIDLKGLLSAVPAGTPLSVEIPRLALSRTVGPFARARMAFEALQKLLAEIEG